MTLLNKEQVYLMKTVRGGARLPRVCKASKSCWRMLIIRSAMAFNSMVHSLYIALNQGCSKHQLLGT